MTQPPRSQFDLTHDVKMSFNFGSLYPCFTMMCMPGDKVNVSQDAIVRAMPLVAPVMHRMSVTIHTFFVPLRLLWPNWEKWATNTKIAGVLPAHPVISIDAGTQGQYTPLMDYLGLPNPANISGADSSETVNAMPFAAYQRIYNDYYRDQNLINDLVDDTATSIDLIDGQQTFNRSQLTTIRKRAWKHDYFTSNLPFAQKGDAVTMPLNFPDVPVNLTSFGTTGFFNTGSGNPIGDIIQTAGPIPFQGSTSINGLNVAFDPRGTLTADTSVLSGSSSINDLRTAEALQRWLERAARGGSRYTEWILSMYGVRSSDARLNRPEYVNGSVTPILISDIPSTAETQTAPQATLAGYGVARVDSRQSAYYCEEFGIMMSILSCLPETSYQQGIEKSLWLRTNDPSELPNPLFMNLGEQEVKLRELYAFTDQSDNTFGYIPRFAEDRFQSSRVAGQMRTTLDFWHLGRIFENAPALNQAFIECSPSYRVFAVTDEAEDHFVAQILNRVNSHRPLTKYNNPSLT
jgi:hypothetical protein